MRTVKKGLHLGLFLTTLILNGCNCSGSEDTWTGHVYPDRNDLTKSQLLGQFTSKDLCDQAALYSIKKNHYQNADYECGKNCEFKPEYSAYVCEEATE